ncbi:hypothetical protein [Halopiger thermotolerans]
MSTRQPTRPWYCYDSLVEAYKAIDRTGGDLRMLQHLKVVRAITTNILVTGIAWYAISAGGDPTLIGSAAVGALAILNGIEIGEWLAAKQALAELDLESFDETTNDPEE